MQQLETYDEASSGWLDQWLPESVRSGPGEEARSARVLLTGMVSAWAICLLFTLVHWSNGDLARAAVSSLTCIPVAGTLGVLWLTGRSSAAVHYLLGLCTLIVTVSPFLAGHGTPALVALVIVPVAAALMSGARAGAAWGVIVTLLLICYASFFPFSSTERKLTWLTVIVASAGGLAATLIERGREQANRDAGQARGEAKADARTRLLAEEALHESQALFATAFRRSSSVLVLVSLETGRILDVNETFVRLSGWRASEVVGKTLRDLNTWTTADDPEQIFERASANGRMESIEVRMRTKFGTFVWLLGSAEVLQQDGRACLLAEGIDITERKRNEEVLARYRTQLEERFEKRGRQLQDSLEQLRQRDRLAAIGTLAAGVAHQINNPIGGIVAATQLAMRMDGHPDRERVRTEALTAAHQEAQRVGRIVKNVLKFSRDEPTAKWVEDITPTVLRAARLAQNHVNQRGGRLEIDLSASPLEVRVSPIDIEQVVLNLIHNASESKLDGADVRVQTLERDGAAEVVISDNGDGIDPAARPHIFEPFFTSRLAEGGSGLGLSVVHGIVTDHGGNLEIEDASAGGTRIRVILPLAIGAGS